MKLSLPLLLVFLFSLSLASAQAVIKQLEVKDYPQEQARYPYEILGYQDGLTYLSHKPALRLSEFEFVYMWQPDDESARTRAIMKYDLLLEELWRTEFELDENEEVLHLYRYEDQLRVITGRYERFQQLHSVFFRTFELDSGKMADQVKPVFMLELEQNTDLHFEYSPNEQRFLFYTYRRAEKGKRVRVIYDFLRPDESLGHKALKVDHIAYSVFDHSLTLQHEGKLKLKLEEQAKTYALGAQVDDDGNVYASYFKRPAYFAILQQPADGGPAKKLYYDHFPDIWQQKNRYESHYPPIMGKDQRLYLSLADRLRMGGRWHTRGFTVLCFDFKAGETNTQRHVETTSTVHIQASRARKEFGLKPHKSFDEYMVKDIIEMEDKSVWLVAQKYREEDRLTELQGPMLGHESFVKAEEILFFEFAPNGRYHRCIVAPTTQHTGGPEMLPGQSFVLRYHQEEARFQLLTHENDGEKLNRAERLFYREIDLHSGAVSERQLVYKGKRSSQLFFKPYTTWLTPELLSILVEDGKQDRTYVVSINLEGEPVEEKKKRNRLR